MSAILGPEMAAPIYGHLEKKKKKRSFCKKTCVHKIPRFRGGGNLGFFWGGSADFIFMGARIFLTVSGLPPSAANSLRFGSRCHLQLQPEPKSQAIPERERAFWLTAIDSSLEPLRPENRKPNPLLYLMWPELPNSQTRKPQSQN